MRYVLTDKRGASGPNEKSSSQAIMTLATSWKGRLKSIFSPLGLLEEILPNGPSGPRAEWRVNFRPQAGNCAGAALPSPSIEMPKGGGRLWRPEPKKEDICFQQMSSFLELLM